MDSIPSIDAKHAHAQKSDSIMSESKQNAHVVHARTIPFKVGMATRMSILLSDKRQTISLAVVAACISGMYYRVFNSLAQSIWQDDMGSYGPIVLCLSSYILVSKKAFDKQTESRLGVSSLLSGLILLMIGMFAYVVGESQQFDAIEVAGFPFLIGGAQILFTGLRAAYRAWFGYALALFAIPWPGSMIDAVTHPMKIAASFGAEHVFGWLGYPVARAGVILTLGPYKLLVADACSGLSSLFALEALGLTYLNIIKHESIIRNAMLAILIVPISYMANVSRVVFIGLISYHFGEAAGQGFLHQFSGLVLFFTALALITSLDSVIRAAREIISCRLRRHQ